MKKICFYQFILMFIVSFGVLSVPSSHAANRIRERLVVLPILAPHVSSQNKRILTRSFLEQLMKSQEYKLISGDAVAGVMRAAASVRSITERAEVCYELSCLRFVADYFDTDLLFLTRLEKKEVTHSFDLKIYSVSSEKIVGATKDWCERCNIALLTRKFKSLVDELIPGDSDNVENAKNQNRKTTGGDTEGKLLIKGGCFDMKALSEDDSPSESTGQKVCLEDFYIQIKISQPPFQFELTL